MNTRPEVFADITPIRTEETHVAIHRKNAGRLFSQPFFDAISEQLSLTPFATLPRTIGHASQRPKTLEPSLDHATFVDIAVYALVHAEPMRSIAFPHAAIFAWSSAVARVFLEPPFAMALVVLKVSHVVTSGRRERAMALPQIVFPLPVVLVPVVVPEHTAAVWMTVHQLPVVPVPVVPEHTAAVRMTVHQLPLILSAGRVTNGTNAMRRSNAHFSLPVSQTRLEKENKRRREIK